MTDRYSYKELVGLYLKMRRKQRIPMTMTKKKFNVFSCLGIIL